MHPTVFISYSWSDDEYNQRVIELSRKLISDGVDVKLDKFEARPGHELLDFMESCVKDPLIDKVIILLDPVYKSKANERVGGVGAEASIISPEIYENTKQEKFIPVIFDKKGKDIKSCIPTFLSSRVYIDLSSKNSNQENYKRLVKTIYGVPEYNKPSLGPRPLWVDNDLQGVNTDTTLFDDTPFYGNNLQINYDVVLLGISNKIETDEVLKNDENLNDDNFHTTYSHMLNYRNEFLKILKLTYALDGAVAKYRHFFQSIKEISMSFLKCNKSDQSELLDVFLHEIFIYTVGFYIKLNKFNEINELTYIPYHQYKHGYMMEKLVDFTDYYDSGHKMVRKFEHFYKKNGEPNLITPKGHYWMAGIYTPLLDKQDFVNADILLTNISVVQRKEGYVWFPIVYTYGDDLIDSIIKKVGLSLRSIKKSSEYYPIFDVECIEDIKQHYQKTLDFKRRHIFFGYQQSYQSIELYVDYIQYNEIGVMK